MKKYYVYILTNKSGTLYIGVTGNLQRRIWEHKNKVVEGFTKKYNIDKLIYFEQTENVMSALEREKQLKKWKRQKKEVLISKANPKWEDLYNQI
ncbi:MAG: GIY-YIG nuclease family protein [Candidatus Moraniibacteriota bacterium]